jgi:putative endonuclease
VAAAYLILKGWQILDRNWRCEQGEIDLVAAADPDPLVFVEVKTRASDRCGVPAEAVDGRKMARLRRLTAAWLACHDRHPATVRIDVIAITAGGLGKRGIEHLEDVTL